MNNHLLIQNCQSGFFSDFNLITSGLQYFYDNKITDFNVIWKNMRYQNDDSNIFEKYFFTNKPLEAFQNTIYAAQFGNLWAPVMDRSIFIKYHEVLKFYKYFDNTIFNSLKEESKKIIPKSTIGVHIRGTDCTRHRQFLNVDYYCQFIDKKLETNTYKNIFVATDEELLLNEIKLRYPNLIFNENIFRSKDKNAVHNHLQYSNKEKFALDVITDGICLSLCEEIIHTSSNVIGYVFMLNPQIKNEHIDMYLPHY